MIASPRPLLLPILLLALGLAGLSPAAPADFFGIHVVDAATGRGVPLMTLTTTHHQSFVTDSAGWVAFQEPGLMDTEVFFHVSGPGYTLAKDGFGYAGKRLRPKAGTTAEIQVQRTNIAERLYRITGQGIYRDSLLLGQPVPSLSPGPQAGVTGQDSVQAVPWQGRLFWLWGDTNVARYPLGNFQSTCAWSDLPEKGGLSPEAGIRLDYLTDPQGAPRKMVPLQEKGPVWVFGLLTVKDDQGSDHLLGHYGRYERLDKCIEHGLVEYREALGHFEPVLKLDPGQTWQHPVGNAVRVTEGGQDHFYFMEAWPVTRVRARYTSVLDPAAYEALAWSETAHDYLWQTALPPITQQEETRLIQTGKIPAAQARFQLTDAATGKPVLMHRSSITWNAYRQRWILIGTQQKGDLSYLGEVWYAEAPAPDGPWRKALKIASHPKYTFYNPRHHPFFDQKSGQVIYFEATYTDTFSGNPVPTPFYDYNQVMYRLDLGDERLKY